MFDLVHSADLLYALSGCTVGVLVGMTGVGGGSLTTPLLILLFGLHPATAVGTDLLFAAATKTAGTLAHGFHGAVYWRVVGRLAAGSMPASALSFLVLSHFDLKGEDLQEFLTRMLSVSLLLTGAALVGRRRILALYAAKVGQLTDGVTMMATVAVGACLGVLVSLSSVGAGAIGVTAVILLYPHLSMVRIVGSDIAHAVPLTLLAGIGHWILGSVDWHLLAFLLVGSVPGILLGSYVSVRLPDGVLRLGLASTLILVGLRLLL